MTEKELRQAIIDTCLEMNALGINQGTSGNVSARFKKGMLITPSGIPYGDLTPEDIAYMPFSKKYGDWRGPHRPSSEWRFHYDIMASRADVDAIVHTHALYATVLSIARLEIPACHYMIAAMGGAPIRCAGYATFGTKELSDEAITALEGRKACLLANHGMIAVGPNLAKALWMAVELETLAKQYYLSRAIAGGPVILDDEELSRVAEKMSSYGLKTKVESA
ncbi:MAG: class II aldolase/adducin family protein [Geminicoccaceae bacterium]